MYPPGSKQLLDEFKINHFMSFQTWFEYDNELLKSYRYELGFDPQKREMDKKMAEERRKNIAVLNRSTKRWQVSITGVIFRRWRALDQAQISDVFKKLPSIETGSRGLTSREQEDTMTRLHEFLVFHLRNSRQIFDHYSAAAHGGEKGTMDRSEYWRLVKDVGMHKQMSSAEIDLLFQKANIDYAKTGTNRVADIAFQNICGRGRLVTFEQWRGVFQRNELSVDDITQRTSKVVQRLKTGRGRKDTV